MIGLSFVTLKFPLLALGLSVVILLTIVLVARKIWKWLRAGPKPEPGVPATPAPPG